MDPTASPLADRRVLLIVGGGIAAYKSLDLVRRLRERGARVRAVLTAGGSEFITALSLASLTGESVHEHLFSLTDEAQMGHIELSRSADIVLVAPATADLMAKVAHGLATDLASTLLLATDKLPVFAPAMNVRMWLHPATVRNTQTLRAMGATVIGPDDGSMACGEFGPGRMAEPLAIVAALERGLRDGRLGGTIALPSPPPGTALSGVRVLVTAGPTQEPIDPVRFISNRSSGKQGFAIAAAAAQAGASVHLVSGPVDLAAPDGVRLTRVETARQMHAAVRENLPADVFVATAAVADWRVESVPGDKLKKGFDGPPVLTLAENPDILAEVAGLQEGRPRLVVGFAAETRDVVANAQAKLARKRCDLVVANDVSPATGVFAGERNTVHLVESGSVENWPTLGKDEVARRLIGVIADRLAARSAAPA